MTLNNFFKQYRTQQSLISCYILFASNNEASQQVVKINFQTTDGSLNNFFKQYRKQQSVISCYILFASNKEASQQVAKIIFQTADGFSIPLPDRLVQLMGSHGDPDVQLAAAGSLVWLHRGGALSHTDLRICNKTVQCLVSLLVYFTALCFGCCVSVHEIIILHQSKLFLGSIIS